MGTDERKAYVLKILHIANEVPFGVDDLIDGLLSLLLSVRDAVDNFSWDRMHPERPRFLEINMNNQAEGKKHDTHHQILKTLLADLFLQSRLGFHIQT
jgi:hypothetical protein